MGRGKASKEYNDPVENIIGLRNLKEDDIIDAIDEKYKWIPANVQRLIEERCSMETIKAKLHIGDIQLIKALRAIKKDTFANAIVKKTL